MHARDLLFVRDASGGSIQVFETLAHESVAPGDQVEVSGFPSLGDYSAVLRDSLVRPVGRASRPASSGVTAEQALTGGHDAALVRIRGRLLDRIDTGGEHVLVLQDGAHVFNAVWQADAGRRLGRHRLVQAGQRPRRGRRVPGENRWRREPARAPRLPDPAAVAGRRLAGAGGALVDRHADAGRRRRDGRAWCCSRWPGWSCCATACAGRPNGCRKPRRRPRPPTGPRASSWPT